MHTHSLRPRLSVRRPLAFGIVLALGGLAGEALHAGELDGQDHTVYAGDNAEAWSLRNEATLTVMAGQTRSIVAHDSTVDLQHALVTREARALQTIQLHGNSTLVAASSDIQSGTVQVFDRSTATLRDSSVTLLATGVDFDDLRTIGIEMIAMTAGDAPELRLENTDIRVVANPLEDHFNSGIGINLESGTAWLGVGSSIDADNVGVMLRGMIDQDAPISLTLNNAHVASHTGAALQVAPRAGIRSRYYLHVGNGSSLSGGDGHLLLVSRGTEGGISQPSETFLTVDDARLNGNITLDRSTVSGTLEVTLRNGAQVSGQFNGVTRVNIGDANSAASRWQLTGDSQVGHLELSPVSFVELGPRDGGTFHTLTLDSFNSNNSVLIFNTVLGDDTSLTDRMVIHGDAHGDAYVVVHNAGGLGGQTADGILLISVGGASDAGFQQYGRIAGGKYEYFLLKGEDGNWYLRSDWPHVPQPCDVDMALPQCEVTLPVEDGVIVDPPLPEGPDGPDGPEGPGGPDEPDGPDNPVLRPEAGAYLANDAAMGQLMRHRAGDRGAMGNDDGLRSWANVDAGERRMDAIGQQVLKANHSRVQIGADIGVFDGGNGRVGALLSAGRAVITSRSSVTGYSAQGEVRGGAFGAYVGWDNGTTFVEASVQQGRFNTQVQGEGLAMERYAARVSQVSVEAGHGFDAGRVGGMGLTIRPELQLTYAGTAMDDHVESNGTVVERVGSGGLGARVGVWLLGEVKQPGKTRLYGSVHVIDDGAAPRLSFDGAVLEGGAPRRALELGVGGQLQLGTRLSVSGGLNFGRGSDRYRELGAKVGVGYRW